MIIYFADRYMNILGQASTELPNGLIITEDLKTEDTETGINIFECKIPFNSETMQSVDICTAVGNYLLRSSEGENEFYTIIDTERDTKKQTVTIYAEDAGLDLLNEVVGEYEASSALPIKSYIDIFAADSGFIIGINETGTLKKQLSWDDESTASARIADVAKQFGDFEVSYSFDVKGLAVTNKYINIQKKRGSDNGVQLRLNKDIDNIITSKSIANLATALRCTGATPSTKGSQLFNRNKTATKSAGGATITKNVDGSFTVAGTGNLTANFSNSYNLTHQETVDLFNAGKVYLRCEKKSYPYFFVRYIVNGKTVQEITNQSQTSAEFEITSKQHSNKTSYISMGWYGSSGKTIVGNTFKHIVTQDEEATEYEAYTGGKHEDLTPVTFEAKDGYQNAYKYDDGDVYISGKHLYSRSALQKWSRYIWNNEPNKQGNMGHITKTFEYNTLDNAELFAEAKKEFDKLREIEVNYEVDIKKLPENVKIGDRVNIIDDEGEQYISTRILMLKTSIADQEQTATLGEYLIKSDGISAKVEALAAEFAKLSVSAARAKSIADNANAQAEAAKKTANAAVDEALTAEASAEEAKAAAETATQTATEAQAAADKAQADVDGVKENVAGLENTVANAQAAAEQAQAAAQTAETKATEAHTAALNAQQKADEVAENVVTAQQKADEAITKAEAAESSAEQAISDAEAAATTAAAAKLDAEAAKKDIATLGENLTTLENTMSVDYARKTDLTETEASLQTQITQNAAEISSNTSAIVKIDETANNAKETAESAQKAAEDAQTEADNAKADAQAAQTAANNAAAAAQAAQNEADTAKAAAATAQSVADKAEADLATAQADLATVKGRVDATEEEIAAAQEAVNTAQVAADAAKADAETAAQKAADAQSTADTAVTNAANAQTAADNAIAAASAAQATADAAKGDASAAQATADEAKANAATAKATADEATANAAAAQTKADEAAAAAATAQQAAEDADAKAAAAQTDLDTAKQNLASVTSRVDATEEEVAAAQEAVELAQAAADKAKADAATAQSTADTAKANAETAQTAADNAQTAANKAQADAEAAKKAADEAQAAVDSLAVRVTKTETDIVQTNKQIALLATKEEVTETLGGYYTKEETDAKITVKADEITSSVKTEINGIQVGGRNLLENSSLQSDFEKWENLGVELTEIDGVSCSHISGEFEVAKYVRQDIVNKIDVTDHEQQYVYSADVRLDNLVKGTVSPYIAIYFSGQYNKSDGTIGYANATTVSGNPLPATHNGEGWVRLEWVLTFPYDFTILYCCVYTRDIEGDFYFKNLKLEKGNKATDWTPAPEDVETGIDSAADTAEQAQAAANGLEERLKAAESTIKQLADKIAMLVVGENGETLMEQTEEGWTFNLKELEKNTNKANSDIKDVSDTLQATNGNVEKLNTSVDELNKFNDYIHIKTEDDKPLLELGETTSEFKVKISNTDMRIMEGSDINTEASNEALRSDKTVAKKELQVGDSKEGHWVWHKHGAGNLGLVWKEGEE